MHGKINDILRIDMDYTKKLKTIFEYFANDKNYKTTSIHGDTWFITDSGIVFTFVMIIELGSLIIEYADSIADAENGITDDGDQINIDLDVEQIINLAEVELRRELHGGFPEGFPGDWIIAESKKYILKGSYETALIYDKSDKNNAIVVGDHYGDVVDGLIDIEEKYCVTVGCGLIVYYLHAPLEDYEFDKSTNQWYELGRSNPNDIKFIESAKQIGPYTIEIVDEFGKKEQICFAEGSQDTISTQKADIEHNL